MRKLKTPKNFRPTNPHCCYTCNQWNYDNTLKKPHCKRDPKNTLDEQYFLIGVFSTCDYWETTKKS